MFFCSVMARNSVVTSIISYFFRRFSMFDFLSGGMSCESCLV